MRNGESKELICMTHGHELSWGNVGGRVIKAEGKKGEKKKGTTVIAVSYTHLTLPTN